MYKAQALQPRLLSWCAFGAGYPGASLECGDLEARRAGEMIAWGGAKRSPRYAKRRLALKVRRHVYRCVGVCKASSTPSRPPGHYRAE